MRARKSGPSLFVGVVLTGFVLLTVSRAPPLAVVAFSAVTCAMIVTSVSIGNSGYSPKPISHGDGTTGAIAVTF
jgi:hypothetical protein